jgi:hypothetical protein
LFLGRYDIDRAALDGTQLVPIGERIFRMLGQTNLGADLDILAFQLAAALEGPFRGVENRRSAVSRDSNRDGDH